MENPVFHNQSFIELIAKEYGNSQFKNWLIDDCSIYGIESKKLGFKQAILLPFGLYIPDIKQNTLEKLILKLKVEEKYSSISINVSPSTELISSFTEFCFEHKIILHKRNCQVLDLNCDMDVLVKNFNETRQKHIKRFIKKDVLKVFPTNDKEYFQKYFEIYEDSVKRWGLTGTSYSYDLISNLHKVENLKLWVAEYDGKMISGMICLYGENIVFDWLAATLINEEYKKLYPAVAVQYRVIENALEMGLKYVNMGASESLEGVKEFKDSWGTNSKAYYSIEFQTSMFKFFKKIQNRILTFTK